MTRERERLVWATATVMAMWVGFVIADQGRGRADDRSDFYHQKYEDEKARRERVQDAMQKLRYWHNN